MKCVESVKLSVKINGHISEVFSPSRGICQGDPLSPYLFLFCAEGLSCLLKHSCPQFLSKGIRVGIHAPWVSHLLFVDDCLVFTQASDRGATRLRDLLQTYQEGLGQMVNLMKSTIFFSGKCKNTARDSVKQILEIDNEALEEKYLGLPTMIGRSSKEAFEPIPRKICGLMGGWGEKLLSYATRETLIKSVAPAIPTYSMSCFLLASDTCKKITSTVVNYWWGSSVDSHGMHWKKWTDLTHLKVSGGMGFRDIRMFNLAMLGNRGWRLMANPSSLCVRVLKGRYYPNDTFLSAQKRIIRPIRGVPS
jgi:hypothetical protein